jgi:hypothetical protein
MFGILMLLAPSVAALLLSLGPAIASMKARRYLQAIIVSVICVLSPLLILIVLMATMLRGMSSGLPVGGVIESVAVMCIAAIITPFALALFLEFSGRYEMAAKR